MGNKKIVLRGDIDERFTNCRSGKLTWENDGGTSTIPLREGDLCSLNEGSVFYIQSNLEAKRRKLRIYTMFTNTEDNTFDEKLKLFETPSMCITSVRIPSIFKKYQNNFNPMRQFGLSRV
ncbi:hypothetical protein Fmac_017786 [Flemingia macrophylla]|uniref:Uncharacterized protein n=1 Tax=Flemingia macrophylla TaxID=520843 RepID=A0ABD1M364_9FABA